MCLPYNLSCRGNHRNYLMNNIPWILWFGMMYCLSRRVSFSENVPSPSVKLIMLYWRETLTLFYGCLCPHINVCLSIKSKLAWANFYLISSLSHCIRGKQGQIDWSQVGTYIEFCWNLSSPRHVTISTAWLTQQLECSDFCPINLYWWDWFPEIQISFD